MGRDEASIRMAECSHCGSFVTDDYVRVFGDNDGNLHECRSCRARGSTTTDETDETGERVVLLRDVNGEESGEGAGGREDPPTTRNDATGRTEEGATPAGEPEETAGRSAADTRRNPGSGDHDDGETAGDGGSDAEPSDGQGGARERLSDLVSSLRG